MSGVGFGGCAITLLHWVILKWPSCWLLQWAVSPWLLKTQYGPSPLETMWASLLLYVTLSPWNSPLRLFRSFLCLATCCPLITTAPRPSSVWSSSFHPPIHPEFYQSAHPSTRGLPSSPVLSLVHLSFFLSSSLPPVVSGVCQALHGLPGPPNHSSPSVKIAEGMCNSALLCLFHTLFVCSFLYLCLSLFIVFTSSSFCLFDTSSSLSDSRCYLAFLCVFAGAALLWLCLHWSLHLWNAD